MKKLRRVQCPYCGRKVGLANAWLLKTQGEYRCPKCGRCSNVRQDRLIYLTAAAAVVLSALFFVVHVLLFQTASLWSFLLVIFPFFAFYLLCPFLVRLTKPEPRRRPPQGTGPQPGVRRENTPPGMEQTVMMDFIPKR
jgi:DNA-directed RNA polymerase subunit RPC12/RpoP